MQAVDRGGLGPSAQRWNLDQGKINVSGILNCQRRAAWTQHTIRNGRRKKIKMLKLYLLLSVTTTSRCHGYGLKLRQICHVFGFKSLT